MACCKSEGYKWVVLVAACFSQMLRAGFISGTLSLFSIYYVGRYSDRTLSSSIGAIQISMANLCAFPATMLNKKIGERWTQIIGGILTAGGMAGTAYTNLAWQGILTNSISTGLGSAFLSAGTYSALSKYFPGAQLVPYAAITVCQNIGVLATPQVIGTTMARLGFSTTFLICSGVMSLNIIVGLLFLPKAVEQASENDGPNRRHSNYLIPLKIKRRKQGIYSLSSVFTVEGGGTYKTVEDAEIGKDTAKQCDYDADKVLVMATNRPRKLELLRSSSLSKLVIEYQESIASEKNYEKKLNDDISDTASISSTSSSSFKQISSCSGSAGDSENDASSDDGESLSDISQKSVKASEKLHSCKMYELVSNSRGISIANMLDSPDNVNYSVKQIFKTKAALNFLLASFITTGGYVAFNSIIGDFSKISLQLTDEQYVLGLTLLGISQLITGILYLVCTRFFAFSASFMYVGSIIGSAAITFILLTYPSANQFYVLMAHLGFFKSLYIASTFAAGMEVTSPAQAVFMFMIVSFVEGVGGIVFPYLSSYLQVQVSFSAGMILAGCTQLLGALSLLPLSLKYVVRPKDYTKSTDYSEKIEQVGYEPNRPF